MGLFSSRTPTAAAVPPPPAPTAPADDTATGEFWKPETPIPVAAVEDAGTPIVMDVRTTQAAPEGTVMTMVEEPTGPIEPLTEGEDSFSLEAFEKLAAAEEVTVAAPAPAVEAPAETPAPVVEAPVMAPEPVMAPAAPEPVVVAPLPMSETAAPVAQMITDESPVQRIEKLQAQASEKINAQQAEVNRLKDEIATLQEKRRDAEAALAELQKLPEQLSKAKTELEIIEKNRQQLATEEQSLASGLEAIEDKVQ